MMVNSPARFNPEEISQIVFAYASQLVYYGCIKSRTTKTHREISMNIQITVADKLHVSSPYNPVFVKQAKSCGGRWNGDEKTWDFDPRDEDRVRDLCKDVYGTDGTPSETVTVRLALDEADKWERGREQEFYFCGRQIARRRERDSAAQLADGVVIIAGGYPSRGGSAKHPTLSPNDGTILEIRDVPAGHADLEMEGVTVVNTSIDKAALLAERDKLQSRLAEIEEMLK